MTADDDSLLETLEIRSDASLVQEIRTALDGVSRGDIFTLDEVRDAMRAAGRHVE